MLERSRGIIFALGACFVWGLIFIVPQFLEDFTSIEVAMGRYFFYGIASLAIFCREWLAGMCRYPRFVWIKAARLAVVASFGYYIWLVMALRYATPAVCALVLGISPIAIAFYGNWTQKECSYRSLMLPSFLILLGLVIINAPHLTASESPYEFLLGIICSLMCLTSWSWYVVANSRFLKEHPEISGGEWSSMLGVTTLGWVGVFGLVFGLLPTGQIDMQKFMHLDASLMTFLVGCAILGLVCSWVGAFLWNRASFYLPVSLAGQLTIFETIFGLVFVFMLEQRLPPPTELGGIMLLLGAVIYGIRQSGQPYHAQHTVA